VRVAVVGGGILGLATARLLLDREPDTELTLFEKEAGLARHQTGRNSGVVHAGIYYEPGSLKARLCRRGSALMRAFCEEHGVPYEACGKVVVATHEDELGRLDRLWERAQANGVPGIRRLDEAQLAEVEPNVAGIAAIHSPETAITDFGAVANALAGEVRRQGGRIEVGRTVARIRPEAARVVIHSADGAETEFDRAVVCAGLQADRLARGAGQPAEPRIVPFRGEYWRLPPERASIVRGLVYPVPDPALPFLGVHLTRRIDGSVLIGPNAVLAGAREGYRGRNVDVGDMVDTLTWPGTWGVFRRHWRSGIRELAGAVSKREFVRQARRYVPSLDPDHVVRAPAGVRAQAIDRNGAMVDDFRIGISDRVVWVRNAPSPAATSSLAIAEELLERLDAGAG
jgi:L-2-hydroxyglutarate oxidase LhgO